MSSIPPLEKSFILHLKPYRETSFLLDLFNASHGFFTALIRGVRQKRSGKASLCQPFVPLFLNWRGRGDLPYIDRIELAGLPFSFEKKNLYCALYLNELMLRLLPKQEPNPIIFSLYESSLRSLAGLSDPAPILRHFEWFFLEALGYGLSQTETIYGDLIQADAFYQYRVDQGFILEGQERHDERYSGDCILNLFSKQYEKECKQLMRKRITALLDKPLLSRELFK